MTALRFSFVVACLWAVAACVTINVYFPEAAAEEAADRFIDEVIGEDEEGSTESGSNPQALHMLLLDLLIPAAHAQADINVNTPSIQAIQRRMAQRYDSELEAYFESGAIGLTNDALVAVRNLSAVGLRDRSKVNAAVAAENRDRTAVYREIAVANGHPEWEDEIRETFAERWIQRARPGWYYQDARGNWVQK
ncbi:MAG: YdbL family protein [Xanthomonadales bacterium]|nr:YdbL family protein [Xanthomonadales bacterium]